MSHNLNPNGVAGPRLNRRAGRPCVFTDILGTNAIMAEQAHNPGTAHRNPGPGVQSVAATSVFGIAPRRFSRSAAAVAILCACMLMFATTLLLAHNHNTQAQRSGHCEICLSIHTAMPAAALPVLITAQAAPEPVVVPALEAPTLLRVDTRCTRAPPTAA